MQSHLGFCKALDVTRFNPFCICLFYCSVLPAWKTTCFPFDIVFVSLSFYPERNFSAAVRRGSELSLFLGACVCQPQFLPNSHFLQWFTSSSIIYSVSFPMWVSGSISRLFSPKDVSVCAHATWFCLLAGLSQDWLESHSFLWKHSLVPGYMASPWVRVFGQTLCMAWGV